MSNRSSIEWHHMLGLRTTILDGNEPCPQLSELRKIGWETDVQLAPHWPRLSRVVIERFERLTDASRIALARLDRMFYL